MFPCLLCFIDDQGFQQDNSKPSVFTTDDQHAALLYTDEREFDVFMTPKITLCLHPSIRLFNAEQYPSLRVDDNLRKFDLRPDFFATHPGFIEDRIPQLHDAQGESQTVEVKLFDLRQQLHQGFTFHFGVPVWELCDSVHIMESKLSLTNSALGEVCHYARVLQHSIGSIKGGQYQDLRILLFDREVWWLLLFRSGTLQRRIKGRWTDGGSRERIGEFFPPPPWSRLLTAACAHFEVDVVNFPGSQSPYLGQGAQGRVFCVQKRNKDERMRQV
jgi:hypothetical protein